MQLCGVFFYNQNFHEMYLNDNVAGGKTFFVSKSGVKLGGGLFFKAQCVT